MNVVTAIRDAACQAARAFARLSGAILSPVFGQVSWNAPPWAQWLGTKAAAGGRAAVAKPLHAALVAVLLAGLLSGGGTLQPGNPRAGGILNNMTTILIDPARLGTQASLA